MLIKVRYLDGTTEMVRPSLLQYLIENCKISEFRRTHHWAIIGVDRIRSLRGHGYSGPERRRVSFSM